MGDDDAYIARFDLPVVQGVPGLAQGAYGDAGNLELVVPGEDGLWVFWFNADPVDHRQGAVRRHWSGGLNFAQGRSFRTAAISQMTAGPNFLEVTAVEHAGARRFYWTPVAGFLDGGLVDSDAVGASPIKQDGNVARVSITAPDGGKRHYVSVLDDYPRLTWRPTDHDGADAPDPLGDEPDSWASRSFAAAAVATSTINGGRQDAVLRLGNRLWHSYSRPDGHWAEPTLIESVVWRRPGDGPVHRHA